jgi:hypothetical protein
MPPPAPLAVMEGTKLHFATEIETAKPPVDPKNRRLCLRPQSVPRPQRQRLVVGPDSPLTCATGGMPMPTHKV